MSKHNIEAILPLSPMQRGILFHSLYSADPSLYAIQFSCPVYGALNVEAFKRAWQRVMDRHSALRTLFAWEGRDNPLQLVRPHVTLGWDEQDWRPLALAEQRPRLEDFLTSDRRRKFDLSEAPLMRMALIRLSADAYQFVWSSHHLLLDGWSSLIVLREAITFYEAFSRGEDLPLQQPRAYRDYIAGLQQQDLSKAEAFWRRNLDGFSSPTPLPLEGVTGLPSTLEGSDKKQRVYLPRPSTAALQSFAREHGVTLNTLVLGAWALLLGQYAVERDVVVGATVSGRPAELDGVESMVGLFINTLPVRVRIDPEAALVTWLREIQAQQVEMRQYEYSPLVDVQGWSAVPRGQPLFQTILVFENYPIGLSSKGQADGGRRLRFGDPEVVDNTNYPLTAMAVPGERLELRVVYSSRLYSDAAATRILKHFSILLESMAAYPEKRLMDLSTLDHGEQHQLLVEWNDTDCALPGQGVIHQLVEAQVERTPDAIAAVFDEQQLSYDQLNRRANQLAHYLRLHGVGPEVLVGIFVNRSPDMLVGLLGILKAGGAYVALDPSYPAHRLALILEDARAPLLLSQKTLIPLTVDGRTQIIYLDSDWGLVGEQSEENPTNIAAPDNLAYAIYTSGSTGKPKGVAIEHHSTVNFLHWSRQQFPAEDFRSILASSSISFDLSVFELFGTLSAGGKTVVVENILHLLSSPAASEVTWVNSVPSAVEELLNARALPASVRRITIAGEPLKKSLAHRIYRQEGFEHLVNLYAPSETTTYSTVTPVSRTIDADPHIGRPIINTDLYVLNENLRPVPVGVAGELYIGGEGVARGYLNRPDLTAEKFVPDPFAKRPGARVYKTGDVTRYLADGNLDFLARVDHQVKIRGFRIELGELETVLELHPAVRQAVALVREDERGDKRLAAYVVAEEGQSLPGGELRAYLKERLPAYMVPSLLIEMEQLPLTPNNKVDRKALSRTGGDIQEPERSYVPPRTEMESAIASIWSEALKADKVGIYDNFFDLGGHSLLLVQVYSKLRARLKPDLLMTDIFKYPTVSSLAEYLSSADQPPSPAQSDNGKLERMKQGRDRLKEGFKQRQQARKNLSGVQNG